MITGVKEVVAGDGRHMYSACADSHLTWRMTVLVPSAGCPVPGWQHEEHLKSLPHAGRLQLQQI